jgi:precorrin-6B C5,15-methyltransferase / cobalt-precorrin-6B C5,C15-methyltransferase
MSSSAPPWLSIVGIGADGEHGLSPSARRCIAEAELVVGAARQLALVEPLMRGAAWVWPTPFATGIARLLERRGQPTTVLASGDPFFFGVGASLAPHLIPGEFVCFPAPSSVSLAAARLGWPLQDTELVSLHGRDLHEVIRHLSPGRRVLALSWNGDTPAELARLLVARGFGASRMIVLEALGGLDERVREARALGFDLTHVQDLNVVGLELAADGAAFCLPCRVSLPDSAFEHDGQLTKRDVRAVTLAALAPRPGARLWDVGAGSGSIGIEWMLAHTACQAIAIERDAERCARIGRNARQLGVPRLSVVHGAAPAVLGELAAPDAIFIGGGASDPALLEACWRALSSRGTMVVNAVALETQALLLETYARLGGELCRIAIETAAPLGGMTTFRPALAVLQWRIEKP